MGCRLFEGIKMDSKFTSFIVPLRDRRDQIPGFIYNIKKYYENFEIIFCCQNDNLLFRKGQLSNLGFKKAKYDIVAFVNLDYRFMSYVNLVEEVRRFDKPIVPFGFAARVTESSAGDINIVRKALPSESCGGCCVFTKEQFVKSCGNSNLIAGWGPDDNILRYRTNFRKLNDVEMGHIVHSKGGSYFDPKVKLRNQNLKMTDLQRDHSKDGFTQTIADEVGCIKVEPNIVEYKFRNIRVPEDFAYMNIYLEIKDI